MCIMIIEDSTLNSAINAAQSDIALPHWVTRMLTFLQKPAKTLRSGEAMARQSVNKQSIIEAKIQLCSDEIQQLFGYRRSQDFLSFEDYVNAVHTDDVASVMEKYQAAQQAGKCEIEHRIIHQQSGETRYLQGRFNYCKTTDGKQRFWVGVVEDITAIKALKNQLSIKHVQWCQVFDSMNDGHVCINQQGIILRYNPGAQALFDFQPRVIIGQSITRLVPQQIGCMKNINIIDFIKKRIPDDIIRGIEVQGVNERNEAFTMLLSLVELPCDNPQQRRFMCCCVDLSALKQKKAQLLRSHKMDAVVKLTGGVAHDFNNILGLILGYGELLRERITDQPKMSSYAEQICHAAFRGANLTSKLLTFSRQKEQPLQPYTINELIENASGMLHQTLKEKVELKFNLQECLWSVELESCGFEDMLLNLCINSKHAMGNVGTLTISTTNVSLGNKHADALGLMVGDHVRLSIRDTGCGMAPDVSEKIFDPFFTTKGNDGTGLGLSLIFTFIQACSGAVKVNSTVGKGTTFTFYFPRSASLNNDNSTALKPQHHQLSGTETILIVDKEPALCELAGTLLKGQGYNVYLATCGKEAMVILAKSEVDLVLADVLITDMNGYQIYKQVKQLNPHIAVLLVSGYGQKNRIPDIEGILPSIPLIGKPYTAEKLAIAIREQLDKRA